MLLQQNCSCHKELLFWPPELLTQPIILLVWSENMLLCPVKLLIRPMELRFYGADLLAHSYAVPAHRRPGAVAGSHSQM